MNTRSSSFFVAGILALVAHCASAQVSLRGIYTNGSQAALPVLFAVRDNETVNFWVFDAGQKKVGHADGAIAANGSFNLPNVAGYAVSGTLQGSPQQPPAIVATLTPASGPVVNVTAPRSAVFGVNGEDLIAGRFEGRAYDQSKPGKTDLIYFIDTNNDIYWIHSTALGVGGGVGTVTPNADSSGGTFSLTTVANLPVTGSFATNDFVMTGTFQFNGGSWDFNAFRPAAANRLGAVSCRSMVGTGSGILIDGFIIAGGPKLVLIRAIGPGLAQYLGGVLALPKLDLYQLTRTGSNHLATNTGWKTASNQAEIAATKMAPLADNDSAILVTLEPGAYTAQVSGADGGTGIGLLDVYEVNLD